MMMADRGDPGTRGCFRRIWDGWMHCMVIRVKGVFNELVYHHGAALDAGSVLQMFRNVLPTGSMLFVALAHSQSFQQTPAAAFSL